MNSFSNQQVGKESKWPHQAFLPTSPYPTLWPVTANFLHIGKPQDSSPGQQRSKCASVLRPLTGHTENSVRNDKAQGLKHEYVLNSPEIQLHHSLDLSGKNMPLQAARLYAGCVATSTQTDAAQCSLGYLRTVCVHMHVCDITLHTSLHPIRSPDFWELEAKKSPSLFLVQVAKVNKDTWLHRKNLTSCRTP